MGEISDMTTNQRIDRIYAFQLDGLGATDALTVVQSDTTPRRTAGRGYSRGMPGSDTVRLILRQAQDRFLKIRCHIPHPSSNDWM